MTQERVAIDHPSPRSTSPTFTSATKRRQSGSLGGLIMSNQVHPEPAQASAAESTLEAPLAPESSVASAEYKHPFSKKQRRIMTAFFTLIASLLFVDQNLLAPNLTDAANFFGFDDTQRDVYLGGYINAAFFAVGAPSALIVGWLADKYNRKNMLFIVAITGQIPCLCTIFVTTYWQFFLTRLLTGISVGGAFPLLYSLLGDLFPISQRAFVSSFIQIATGAGVFVGQMIAGWVGPSAGWRWPFFIVAVPSIVCSVAMLFFTREPPRGACEEALQREFTADSTAAYSEKITWPKVKILAKVPSNWLIVLQGLPGSLTWGVFMTYFNDYLQQNDGWDAGIATLVITVFGVGAALGVLGGGFLGQWLYNKRKEYSPVYCGICVLIAIGPFMFLINVQLNGLLGAAMVMAFLGGMFGSVAGPNIKAVMLNVNDPEARGVALALSTMTDDLGKALGPLVVAGFITILGRQTSFNIAVLCGIPAAIMIMCVSIFIRKDEANMQARLDAWLKEHGETCVATLSAIEAGPGPHPSDGQPGDGGEDGAGAAHGTLGHNGLQDPTHPQAPLLQQQLSSNGGRLAAGVRATALTISIDGAPAAGTPPRAGASLGELSETAGLIPGHVPASDAPVPPPHTPAGHAAAVPTPHTPGVEGERAASAALTPSGVLLPLASAANASGAGRHGGRDAAAATAAAAAVAPAVAAAAAAPEPARAQHDQSRPSTGAQTTKQQAASMRTHVVPVAAASAAGAQQRPASAARVASPVTSEAAGGQPEASSSGGSGASGQAAPSAATSSPTAQEPAAAAGAEAVPRPTSPLPPVTARSTLPKIWKTNPVAVEGGEAAGAAPSRETSARKSKLPPVPSSSGSTAGP